MNNREQIIISVDGGGSGSRYAVINKDGTVINEVRGGIGSPAVDEAAVDNIFNKLLEVYNSLDLNIYTLKAIIIGMSGFALVDVPNFKKKLEDKFNAKIILENDAELALQSILKVGEEQGIVAVSGTGAIILAKNNDKIFSTNGWGQLLTERGSSYTCVKDFVCKMIHDREQYGCLNNLEQSFMDYLGYKDIEEFKMLFYRTHKNNVGSKCAFFKDEAAKGNIDAKKWLYYNGTLLGEDIINAAKRTNLKDNFILGFRGGFFNNNIDTIKGAIDTVLKSGLHPTLEEQKVEPYMGGYNLALKENIFDE